ncbi:pentapeptide repeat-containing protein [Streptomyces coeruleorubidus]|uniref:pentapeptide repeat-containing protein n=1 Tax=Streptomyces coeruleorubidus TaxID=116188 RepID=UPI0036C3C0A1
MKPKTRRVVVAAALGLVVVGYALLLWKGAWWIDGAHLRTKNLQPADGVVITGFRTMLVALGAGAVAALGLYYTHKGHKQTEALFEHTREKDREQAELTREGQVTERYVEAIKLLSSDNLTQRLGGIYALERIMRDSEKDHATVVAVLAAFVRQHAPVPDTGEQADKDGRTAPAEEVQAALTVLVRRPRRKETFGINLARTDLRYAMLRHANLDGANLSDSRLDRADLRWASLRRVNLDRANLDGSDLVRARLAETSIMDTSMEGTELSWASLEGVIAFSPANLLAAQLSRTTGLPSPAAADPDIAERIRECDTRRVWVKEPEPWPDDGKSDERATL